MQEWWRLLLIVRVLVTLFTFCWLVPQVPFSPASIGRQTYPGNRKVSDFQPRNRPNPNKFINPNPIEIPAVCLTVSPDFTNSLELGNRSHLRIRCFLVLAQQKPKLSSLSASTKGPSMHKIRIQCWLLIRLMASSTKRPCPG